MKKDADTKREKEKKLVSQMIALYCKKQHGYKQGLCAECEKLDSYARQRSDKCPFMETKTFCSNCKVHCYKPEMREKIRQVMRFSGPRMIFSHPVAAVSHVILYLSYRRFHFYCWRRFALQEAPKGCTTGLQILSFIRIIWNPM